MSDTALETAQQLSRRFATTAAELDASGAFPRDNVAALHAAGLTNLVVAAEHGGGGAGLVTARRVVSEIARGEPSTALILAMHLAQHATIRAGRRWPAHLADRLVTESLRGPALVNALQVEPEAGSPSYGTLPHTTARRDGEGWRVSGRKRFATGCEGLHWFIVSAVTDEPVPRHGSFAIPHRAPGIRILRTWDSAGMRATGSHDVVFEDVPVPYEDTLDLAPASLGPRRDEAQMVWFMALIGAVYHGVARALRDDILAFAARQSPGGLGASLATLPRIQDELGAIEVLVESSERLLDSLAAEADAGGTPGAVAAMLRLVVLENALRAAERALVIAGNAGVSRQFPFERHHRNLLCGRTHAPNPVLVRANAAKTALARLDT
ncbi:Acyl-CoA dehydrogenase [Rhodovastum atsumiense]|uniref:Acyl-CoA dehydrogenase n=1 Tax=Rhodovastum atsumiense TaxID=504468 RepID=A0A5M6IZS2_9PROT|nr:acyl-CoA dehydrogenase family protein [Rhodovastum atsumiense]KAA5613836.1 acyl-CoA dehydrogenase [Rhodovastum atsumiense]CAH2601945.1 Acyl-CoA dehydrogenase [Rhodovastum atsumiense]